MTHLDIRCESLLATVTLNRPEVRNAFNDEVIAELSAAFQAVDRHASRAGVGAASLAQCADPRDEIWTFPHLGALL